MVVKIAQKGHFRAAFILAYPRIVACKVKLVDASVIFGLCNQAPRKIACKLFCRSLVFGARSVYVCSVFIDRFIIKLKSPAGIS